MTTILLDNNARAHLVFREGRKLFHAVTITPHCVKVVKFQKSELQYMRNAQLDGKPYPVARAVRRFNHAAKVFGITKNARKALREAV